MKLKTDYITLGQLLKIVDIISSGGQAKWFLQENDVLINGELDNRRGRKLYPNDLVEIPEQESVIHTTDRGTLMNLLVETNAYASGSGVVTGFTKKEIRLVPLAPALENRICLLFPKNREISPIGRYFIKELKALFKKEVDTKTFSTKE